MEAVHNSIKLAHKDAGNKCFKEQNVYGAIDQYSRGLKIDPNDIDLLSNRAQAYINYKLPRLALQDAEKALQINPTHHKCIHRKTKALWGLRKYEEAAEFLNSLNPSISKSLMDNPVFTDLKKKSKELLKQSRGEFDMEKMLDLAEDKIHEVAEFTGPIEIAEIPGKGNGIIATKDILPGQLLLCSKAFAIIFGHEDKKDLYLDEKSVSILTQDICERLAVDPESCEEFAKLYDGGPIDPKQRTKWRWTNTDDEKTEQQNIREVRARIMNNSFCGDGVPNYTGLWLLPSYFNHSCIDNNAHWIFFGDLMFIRALQPIRAGEEVMIYYFAAEDPDRINLLETNYKFSCNCRLCDFDKSEALAAKEAVKTMMELINRDLGLPEWDVDIVLTRIKWVMSLRAESPTLNLALLDPCIEKVALKLYASRRFKDVAEILTAVRNMSVNTCHIYQAVQTDMTILSCFLYLGERTEIFKWIDILKQDLIVAYGCKEIVGKVGKSIVESLEEAGLGGIYLFKD